MLANESVGKYVNIKNGKLITKKEEEKITFDTISGKIVQVDFFIDDYANKEKVKLFIKSDENYILQMHTDSGYFRGFCNSLKSSQNPKDEISITPQLKVENNKSITTCFVQQEGKYLKHYFTRDFNGKEGDFLPQLKKIEFKGKSILDNSEQIDYWKNWLIKTFNN